jgi:hypothetical protein
MGAVPCAWYPDPGEPCRPRATVRAGPAEPGATGPNYLRYG